MSDLISSDDYQQWIVSIKQRVQASQIKATVAVNRELLDLYWFLGGQILEKQQIRHNLCRKYPGAKTPSFWKRKKTPPTPCFTSTN